MRAATHAFTYRDLSLQRGNDTVDVIPEGTASGMSAAVNPRPGRRPGINPDGAIGFLAPDLDVFAQAVIAPDHYRKLARNVRFAQLGFPRSHHWRSVFDDAYRTCETGLGVITRPNLPVAELAIEQ